MTAQMQISADLDPVSFRAIADLAYRESGLTLVEEKSSMIRSRLRHRLRDLGLPDFSAYSALLQSEQGKGELRYLISALTTNVSHFFRESHHYDTMIGEFEKRLPDLRAGKPMRIWSAGCSNGQEPLSAAMRLIDHTPTAGSLDLRILATDIDSEVVQFARRGLYPERLMGGVSETLLQKYFSREDLGESEPFFRALPSLTSLIRFNELNLLAPWPMTRRFDVIFCRNVVIYFDVETQRRLWPRLHAALAPDGVLFLGHSERIADPGAYGFDCTGPTTYRPIAS
ncbi:protein-glutamate O-methyltransferase CheR [Marimonas sp. MJW-29]|uniref:Chemotaxis protein methyltransferase n=1 Tax=Sulfitobacter sediminis TaxID=3234186 RepID=A0ABV3RU97_9RHOB